MPAAPGFAQQLPLVELAGYVRGSVLDFGQEHGAHIALNLVGQGNACCLAAGVDLQGQRRDGGFGGIPVYKANDEGHHAMHPRTAGFEQLAGSLLAARHQGFALAV
jgi:hypothetical protein